MMHRKYECNQSCRRYYAMWTGSGRQRLHTGKHKQSRSLTHASKPEPAIKEHTAQRTCTKDTIYHWQCLAFHCQRSASE